MVKIKLEIIIKINAIEKIIHIIILLITFLYFDGKNNSR
jgi:hypothetical protein